MAVIEFEHVSKSYHLGASRTSLREAIPQMTRKLFGRNGHQDDQLFWALNDVSFKVEQGEVLGIIGHNGAGKSTTLKLLSKVSYPSSGHIHTRGRMAALIELGAGFHPDLSGRENIYLNGSILGLTQREIDAQFSNIVEFAGLEKFIDTPIKRYSSGMYVRLAFAVAAHVKADLLLVDEVLSVGDMAFQQKSLAKMNELRDSGTTIIFVSHNLPAIRTFCSRALLLNAGRLAAVGETSEVVQAYRQVQQENRMAALMQAEMQNNGVTPSEGGANKVTSTARITKIELLNKFGQPTREFQPTDGLTVRYHYDISPAIGQPVCMLRVRRRTDSVICFTEYLSDPNCSSLQGQSFFEVRIDQLQLLPGRYTLETNIHTYYSSDIIEGVPELFSVTGKLPSEYEGVYQPNIEWSFDSPEKTC